MQKKVSQVMEQYHTEVAAMDRYIISSPSAVKLAQASGKICVIACKTCDTCPGL